MQKRKKRDEWKNRLLKNRMSTFSLSLDNRRLWAAFLVALFLFSFANGVMQTEIMWLTVKKHCLKLAHTLLGTEIHLLSFSILFVVVVLCHSVIHLAFSSCLCLSPISEDSSANTELPYWEKVNALNYLKCHWPPAFFCISVLTVCRPSNDHQDREKGQSCQVPCYWQIIWQADQIWAKTHLFSCLCSGGHCFQFCFIFCFRVYTVGPLDSRRRNLIEVQGYLHCTLLMLMLQLRAIEWERPGFVLHITQLKLLTIIDLLICPDCFWAFASNKV